MENTNTEANENAEGTNSSEETQNQENNAEKETEKTAETETPDGKKEDAGDDTEKDQESEEESKKEEFDLELPEGSVIEDKAEFVDLLKGAVESQEGFDKLGKFIKDISDKGVADQAEAEKQTWDNTVAKWKNELKSDETFGQDVEGNTKLALDTAKDIGLDKWLKETGFDKNPDILKAMRKVGQERADASMHMGGKTNEGHTKNRDGSTKFTFDKT